MRLFLACSSLLFLACASGCGDEPSRDPGEAVRFSLAADLAPGQEGYLCRYVQMPKSADPEIFVRGGSHDLSEGGHHYLVYRTKVTEWKDGMDRVVPCGEHEMVMTTATTYVTGGQTPHENADFPAGIAMSFAPGEILLLQAHFLNAGSAPKKAHVDVTLRTTAASAVAERAGVLRFYDPFITIPPRGKSRATMRCTIKRDVTLLSAAAHMHRRGTAYAAYVDPPNGPPSAEPFYTTKDGMHPTFFLGSMKIPAGSKIRFACDYESDEDRLVTQGPSAERDEMCMFNAFYYPAMSPGDESCEDMDEHGTGDQSCAATTSCLEQCPASDRPDFASGSAYVGACWQQCITRSCPNVTGALFPQLTCTAAKCTAECAEMGETCRACVRERCVREVSACQRLACGP
jgi:hypothetical protein